MLLEYDEIHASDFKIDKRLKYYFKEDLSLETVEKQHILLVLQTNQWNIKKSSKDLGISRAALYRRIDKYGLSDEVL